jgi:hypothetical protein
MTKYTSSKDKEPITPAPNMTQKGQFTELDPIVETNLIQKLGIPIKVDRTNSTVEKHLTIAE